LHAGTGHQEWASSDRIEGADLWLGRWITDYADPYNWYNELWDSATDARWFNGGWQNRYYNALVRLARVELSPAAREALYQQAEAILAREYIHIPLLYEEYDALVKPYVRSYKPSPIHGYTSLAQVAVVGR
jgi:oligopeptide transport system substrate-binding protein